MIFFLLLFLLISCNDSDDPQEKITKLRTIGVKVSPLVNYLNSGEQTFLEVHLAIPLDANISVTTTMDDGPILNLNRIPIGIEDVEIDQNSFQYEDFNSLRHAWFEAAIDIPNEKITNQLGEAFEGAQLQYAFEVSDGTHNETIVGNFLLAADSTKKNLDFTNLSITKSIPTTGKTLSGSEHSLSMVSNNPNTEDLKYGWFTSQGRMSNRRSSKPIWIIDQAGDHTIIATVRGTKSRSFDYVFLDIKTN